MSDSIIVLRSSNSFDVSNLRPFSRIDEKIVDPHLLPFFIGIVITFDAGMVHQLYLSLVLHYGLFSKSILLLSFQIRLILKPEK